MASKTIVPDLRAGRLTRLSIRLLGGSDDGFLFLIPGGILSFVALLTGFIGTFSGPNEYEFLAWLLIPLFYIVICVVNANRTKEIHKEKARFYVNVYTNLLPRIKGHANMELARPMAEMIHRCTLDDHPGADSRSFCKLCLEREKLIKELVPVTPQDTSDIAAAKRFLEMKREADEQHKIALKELTS